MYADTAWTWEITDFDIFVPFTAPENLQKASITVNEKVCGTMPADLSGLTGKWVNVKCLNTRTGEIIKI